VRGVNVDDLVLLFNTNNDDIEREGNSLGPTASRRSWEVERFIVDPVMKSPDEGWAILNALVEGVDDRPDGALDYLGAYLVEDFVRQHGVEFLDQLEAAARKSPRWRRALAAARGWENRMCIDHRVSNRLLPYIELHRANSDSGAASTSGDIRER
jgi:hypothetical protein